MSSKHTTSLENDILDARANHTISSILGTRKKIVVCPLPAHHHSSNTPSFSIFWENGMQRFRCHGPCGLAGDVVDFVGFMNIPDYDDASPAMRRKALRHLDMKYEKEFVKPEKQIKLPQSAWTRYVPAGFKAYQYALRRGLTQETITKFKLGQYVAWNEDAWLTIPTFENTQLVGIKMRNTENKDFRFMNVKGSKQALFNIDAVAYKTGPVFVVKGEIPCMVLDQEGFSACAPTAGEAAWRPEWKLALELSQNIVIGDNDGPGRELGEKRAQLLGARLVFPNPNYKDIDEMYLANKESAISLLRKWSENG